ncbi:MAG: hypothetical protein JWM57_1283, partial [Phycisphaerales bacterium]|nr:hypothetical protein [Phycisphaerales bacterium]
NGTYAARAGNAADRSLLLATLLTKQKIAVRYAMGTLSDEAAGKLADRVFAPSADSMSEKAKNTGDSAPSPFTARVQARATRDFANITTALGDRMPKTAMTRHDLIAEVKSHVWLQAKVGDDWVDLDSSFADAAPGKHYCEPQQTADALPADRFQQITLRLTVERLDGGKLTTATALEQTSPAADLADRQIFVLHQPASGLKGLGGAVGGSNADALVPVLWIDGQAKPGTPVDFANTAGEKAAAPKAGAVGDALSALSAAPDEPAAPTTAAAQLVAEYLDTEITRPGGPAIKHRRVLIDRAGAAWRATGTHDAAKLRPLARNAQGPIDAQTIHNLQISTGAHDMWSYASAMNSLATGDGPTEQSTDFAEQAWPIAMQNLATVMWADGVLVPAMNQSGENSAARFYCDSPRLVLFSLSAQAVGTETELATQIDLMHDTVRGVAKDTAGATAAARGKLWYGVAEGALEHEITAEQAFAMGATPYVESTSALAGDGALSLVDTAHPAQIASAAPADTAPRMQVAAARGDTLVVPAGVMQGGESGWWAISPSGDTRAVVGEDYGMSRSLYRGAPGGQGGGSPAAASRAHPNYNGGTGQGSGRGPAPRGGNMQSKARTGGNEYLTILMTVSIPNWISFCVVTYSVVIVVFLVTKELYR